MAVKISQMDNVFASGSTIKNGAIFPLVQDEENYTITFEELKNNIISKTDEIHEPNMVGKFADFTTASDWFWYPNGEKVSIPVDPITYKFSFYFEGQITSPLPFGENTKIEQLYKMPQLAKLDNDSYNFSNVFNSESFPVIDCTNFQKLTNMFVNNSIDCNIKKVHFENTNNITEVGALFDLKDGHQLKMITGLDLEKCQTFYGIDTIENETVIVPPLGKNSAAYIEIKNIGKNPLIKGGSGLLIGNGFIDLRAKNWGNDEILSGSKESLINSLNNVYDRKDNSYGEVTIYLYKEQYDRLTEIDTEIIDGIVNKGYVLEIYDSDNNNKFTYPEQKTE